MNRVCHTPLSSTHPRPPLCIALSRALTERLYGAIPAMLIALAVPHAHADAAHSAGGGDRSAGFAGVGGSGNGQGGAGGGYFLPWNGSGRSDDGQGSSGTGNGYEASDPSIGQLGAGGAAAVSLSTSTTLDSAKAYTGASAGNGGDSLDGRGGGGGGGAGAAVALSGDGLNLVSAAVLTGGNGGNGGNGGTNNLGGGGGGGGAGLHANTSNSTLDIGNVITGGNGGNAGNAAGGGGAGDGIVLNGSGNTLNSTASITGGSGGARGAGGTSSTADGQSGVGVRINGNGNTLVNAGAVAGGVSSDGQSRANAVEIRGNDNAVQLLAGSTFSGNVQVMSGSGNRVLIGEDNDGSFDLSRLTSSDNASSNGSRFVGFSTLEKTGNGTWVLEGSNTGVSATEVNQGSLIVGGSLGSTANLNSDVRVANGALLGGHGLITGNLNLLAGSTLSPGNSIGTLRVNGGVSFDPTSTLDIETHPDGSSDKLIATANVALNDARLNIIAGSGNWLPSTRYTIIEAGSVSGTFGQIDKNLPFLTPVVTYNADSVVLTLNRNATSFASVGDTPNQSEAARAVDGLAVTAPVAVAVSALDADAAKRAYDSLSGELHASLQSALLDDTRYLREGINARMLSTQGLSPELGALNADGNGLVFWLRGYGAQATTQGDGNGARVTRDSRGMILGGDLALGEQWRLGAALSLGSSDIDDARQSSADVENQSLALFASGQFSDFNLRLGASRSWHDIDSSRQVDVGALSERNKASYQATTDQLFAELGYRVPLQSLQLEPYIGLTHARFSAGSFREQGGSTALQSQGEKQQLNLSSLGVRASLPLAEVAGLPLSAQGGLSWQHAFGSIRSDSQLVFVGADSYRVSSAAQNRDSALIEGGIAVQLNPSTLLDLTYSGRFSSYQHDDSLRLGITLGF